MHAAEISVLETTLRRVKFLFKGLKVNHLNREVLIKFLQHLTNQGVKNYSFWYTRELTLFGKSCSSDRAYFCTSLSTQKVINRLSRLLRNFTF
jgi:hypothetical protein